MGWFKFFIKDMTVLNLITDYIARSEESRKKHNNTMDQVETSIDALVQDALEEAMDLTVYLKKLKEILNENPDLHKIINRKIANLP
tara:strand:+ start:1039 stop:1296 length:258 start_codon:yes stop_codon:yes gene_type:complete